MIAGHVWLGVALLINGRAIGLGAGLVIKGWSLLLKGDCLFLFRTYYVGLVCLEVNLLGVGLVIK